MGNTNKLIFLKLGGSLITDKLTATTVRQEIITRIAEEIKMVKDANPDLQILLGHGSGSFGHMPAKKYGTRQGVKTLDEWQGFGEVWFQATALNRIVIETLHKVGLSAISFPASSSTISDNGKIISWDSQPIKIALSNNIVPVVFGDVVFDHLLGGTILSTEDIFFFFAKELNPQQILLSGLEAGVYADYPICSDLIAEITPQNFQQVLPALEGSAATDVTGGMATKVKAMLSLTTLIEGLEVMIFSGEENNAIKNALTGKILGTKISS